MKTIKPTIVILIFILVVIPAFLTFGISYIPSLSQPSLVNTQRIDEREVISQTFIEKNNNLAEVAVTLKNPDLKNKEDIIFSLFDSNGQLLRTVTRNGSSIIDGDFVKFQFVPIPNSENQTYMFTLSAPRVNSNDALEAYTSPNSASGEILKVNDKVATGSASFATFYRIPNRFFVLKIVISEVTGKFFGDPIFAIVYIAVLLGCMGYLAKDFFKK